jgi:16S rRNA processing protein RimM
MSDDEPRVLLGHISAAHGLRGEVVLKSHTADPGAIADYGPLLDEAGTQSFRLSVLRVTDKGVVARVAGVTDRTAAEKLKGVKLYVARAQLPATEEGAYYHADLIGLDVVSASEEPIGHIVAVQNYGAGDLLEIRLAGSRQTELIPFVNAYVPVVDIAKGHVVVTMPELVGDDEEDGFETTDDDGESDDEQRLTPEIDSPDKSSAP